MSGMASNYCHFAGYVIGSKVDATAKRTTRKRASLAEKKGFEVSGLKGLTSGAF
jgi:hypothetical protein